MPLVSGLNGDNKNIPQGAPVAGKFDRLLLDTVVLAGGSTLAAGVVTSGAGVRGVVNLRTDGVVDLIDWSLATNSKHLTVGQTYRLSAQEGRLTTSGNGQIIGLAASKTELTLQISAGTAEVEEQIDTTNADLAAEIAARIAGDGALASTDVILQNQITAEVAARIAADIVLQIQITELQQPVYERHFLLGGM